MKNRTLYLESGACLIFLVGGFIVRSKIASPSFKDSTGRTLVIASVLVAFMFIFNIALTLGAKDVRKVKRWASRMVGSSLVGIIAVLSFAITTISLYPKHSNTFEYETRLLLILIVAFSAFWYLQLLRVMIDAHQAVRSSERDASGRTSAADDFEGRGGA